MKDKIEFTVKNLNREKLLKQVLNICTVSDIKISENKLKFKVNKKHKKDIEKIIDKCGVSLLNKTDVGIFSFLKKTIFRIGVLIPIIVFIIFIFISNLFVFNYKIIGNQLVPVQEIEAVLKQHGLTGIVPKNKIDAMKIENALLQINKVSLVSVIVHGNSLVINIKEKVYNPEYEEQGEFDFIYSEFDGIITQISPVQGTVLVKVGQTVKKGEKLVAPYVMDTAGQTLYVKPMADIKADVFFTTIEDVADTKIEMIDTGNVYKQKTILFLGLPIYKPLNQKQFTTYRTEQTINFLSYGNLLPIKVETITYFEQIENVVQNYFETNKEQILNECKQKTRQLVKDYEIIKEEYQTVTCLAGINRITTTVMVNKSIC